MGDGAEILFRVADRLLLLHTDVFRRFKHTFRQFRNVCELGVCLDSARTSAHHHYKVVKQACQRRMDKSQTWLLRSMALTAS